MGKQEEETVRRDEEDWNAQTGRTLFLFIPSILIPFTCPLFPFALLPSGQPDATEAILPARHYRKLPFKYAQRLQFRSSTILADDPFCTRYQFAMRVPLTTEQLVKKLFSLKQDMRDAETKSTELAKRELALIQQQRTKKEELEGQLALCTILQDDLVLYGTRPSKIDVWFAEIGEIDKGEGQQKKQGEDGKSSVLILSTHVVSVPDCLERSRVKLMRTDLNLLRANAQNDMSLDSKERVEAMSEHAMLTYAGSGSRSSPIEID